ncbi:DUF3043 domain-containing protein [Nocardioides sp.]|uniref:DUF3043 domain-containing protein n=1 Tax=Nocardioides sp. TaxID=35761 RepID=UPI002B8DECC0|nr:DUF3043 domain-containing protein [Nocardioides sp.]HVX53363.1 DUF3043 domain-containing protein [Nocardioides sp.]
MLRRKSAPATTAEIAPKPGGKGRPTRSRKEAEAENKARAKGPRSNRRGSSREQRAQNAARMREALRTGDDRYLPARDKGPVRRFVRDFVDSRISFAELALPLVVICFVPSFVGSTTVVQVANEILLVMIVVIALNLVFLRFKLGRELTRRFPGQPTRGLTWYMCSRALQLRFIRAPRAQVRIGQQLPDTYR